MEGARPVWPAPAPAPACLQLHKPPMELEQRIQHVVQGSIHVLHFTQTGRWEPAGSPPARVGSGRNVVILPFRPGRTRTWPFRHFARRHQPSTPHPLIAIAFAFVFASFSIPMSHASVVVRGCPGPLSADMQTPRCGCPVGTLGRAFFPSSLEASGHLLTGYPLDAAPHRRSSVNHHEEFTRPGSSAARPIKAPCLATDPCSSVAARS